MAKKGRKSYNEPRDRDNGSGEAEVQELRTTSGHTIIIKPLSPFLLDKLNTAFPVPDPPTYEIETATGDIETHFHDEESLETGEDREAWEAYNVEFNRIAQEKNDASIKVFIDQGVILPDEIAPEIEHWKDLLISCGIPVPKSEIDQKVEFVKDIVLTNPDDIMLVMSEVVKLSGVSEKLVRQAEDSFRDQVEGNIVEEPVSVEEEQLESHD
jgi:hypothetical protein